MTAIASLAAQPWFSQPWFSQPWFSQPWVGRLGWTLAQFLWQGALIAGLYALARGGLRRAQTPQVRYLLACAALGAMVAAPIVTYILTATSDSSVSNVSLAAAVLSPAPIVVGAVSGVASPAFEVRAWRDELMPWLVMTWLTGATIFWVRLLGGWVVAARMRAMLVRPAPPEWQRTLDDLRRRIRVSTPVRLLISALVRTPTVVGWLRPVVLVPVAALTGLPSEQVEALLAHELAHIRRQDYLVNILQSVAEALLFYHPAVWWISNHIRSERESCCDDVAVSVSVDAITYARALESLESARPEHLTLSLAANGGLLKDRIARLLGIAMPASGSMPGSGAMVCTLLLLATSLAVFGQPAQQLPEFEVASIKPSPVTGPRTPMRVDSGRVTYNNLSPKILIQMAYKAPEWAISGGPAWLDSDRFDITATLPSGASEGQIPAMLQALLIQRFHLTTRRNAKELPAYELTVAKNGPKLKPGESGEQWNEGMFHGGIFSGRVELHQETMPGLAELLAGKTGRPVIDATHLTGVYDISLKWTPDEILASSPNATGTSLFTALEEQLGLKLESKKAPVEVLVIEHMERPLEN